MHTFEVVARALMVIGGLAMFLHYSAMAGYTGRAPWPVKYLLYPVLVGDGLFLVGCGLLGYMTPGLWASSVAAFALLALYLTVFEQGGHVSAVFEQRARERDLQRMRYYVGGAMGGVELVAGDVVSDSGLAELQAAQKRERRQRMVA